jgi:hypothetical protein
MGTSALDTVKDAGGVEFGLIWGIGRVKEVAVKDSKARNGRAVFEVDGFRFESSGSVELRRQAGLIAQLKEAIGTETYFAFRIESHRDEKWAKDVPFSEVIPPTDARHSRLIAAYPDGTVEARDLIARCEAEAMAGTVGAEPLAASYARADSQASEARAIPNEPPRGQMPGDSWEFAAKDGCVMLAFDEWEHARKEGLVDVPMRRDIKRVAESFLRIADYAQSTLSGALDRGGRAHTRARGALRTVIQRDRPPFGLVADEPGPLPVDDPAPTSAPPERSEGRKTWQEWEDKVKATTLGLLRIADEIGRDNVA